MSNNDIFEEIKKFSVDTAATCMNMLNKLVKLNENKMEEVKTDVVVEDAAVVSEDAAVVSEDAAVVSEDAVPVVEIPVNLDGEVSISGVDTTGNNV